MRTAAILLLLAGAAACGTSQTPPAKSPAAPSEGAASLQAKDDASRALTEDECKSLGQSIIDTCHGQNTRSAELEGWCGDVVTGVGSGTWTDDCQKHMKYMDAVCITSNTSIRSMMDCDAAVTR